MVGVVVGWESKMNDDTNMGIILLFILLITIVQCCLSIGSYYQLACIKEKLITLENNK